MNTKNGGKKSAGKRIKIWDSEKVVQIIIYILVVLLCLSILLPYLNVVALSFNDGADSARGGVYFWPRLFTFVNYKKVFADDSIMPAYRITIARTLIGTFSSLMVTSLAAYALREAKLPGVKLITMLITFCMLFSGGMIPTYIQYNNLHILNTFWVYIIPSLVNVTYLIMMRTFFESIPPSLEESAKIDGCGYFKIYLKIILPLSKPVLAVVGLYTAVNQWNDWFSGAFYMRSSKLWPVQTVLQQMLTRAMASQQEANTASQAIAHTANAVTSDSLKMSAVIVTTVPILCVYPFVQKYFAQGALIGAVKE